MKRLTLRILLPTTLLLLGFYQYRIGGNALPIWISTLAIKNDLDPVSVLKFLIAIELVLSTVFYAYGDRLVRLAQTCLAAMAFVALAECSAAFKRGETSSVILASILALMSAGLLLLISRPNRSKMETGERTRARTSSGIGIFTCVVICFVGIAIPLNTNLPPRTISDGAIMARDAPAENEGSRIIEMNPMQWVGRSIIETPIGQFTPDAIGQLGEKGILILYNPRCGTCHDLFAVYFSEGADLPLVALEVPPTEEAVILESEYPDEVDCPTCVFMSLPQGPLWLVGVPYVMVIENGVVTCVAMDGPGDCL